MIKAVLFDLGDTLVDMQVHQSQSRHRKIIEGFGIDPGPNFSEVYLKSRLEFMKKYHSTVSIHYRRHFFRILLENLEKETEDKNLVEMEGQLVKVFLDEWLLFPESIRVLEFCRNAGLSLGLISGGTSQFIRKLLEKFGLEKYFEIVLISEDLGHEKSSLVPFKVFLEKSGLQPEECLMVGDRLDDDIMAKRIGMKTVHISGRVPVVGPSEKPDFQISKIGELIPILENLLK